jgi:hypothetical protein
MRCLSCGGEISPKAAACPHCGQRRRPRLGSPEVWERAALRTRATVLGLLLAALIIGVAGFLIYTNHRREPQDAPNIIIQGGNRTEDTRR